MDTPNDDAQLLDLLVRATAGGKVDPDLAVPIVTQLLASGAADVPVAGTAELLLVLLESKGGAESAALADWLRSQRLEEALRYHRESVVDDGSTGRFQFFLGHLPKRIVPVWDLEPALAPALIAGLDAVDGVALLRREGLDEEVPELSAKLARELASAARALCQTGGDVDLVVPGLVEGLPGCSRGLAEKLWAKIRRFQEKQREQIEGRMLVGELPTQVNDNLLLESLRRKLADANLAWEGRRSILIACCHWKSPALEPVVRELVDGDARLAETAELLLRMRFGAEVAAAGSPMAWFEMQGQRYEAAATGDFPAAAVLRLWLAEDADLGADDMAELERMVAEGSETTRASLAQRWKAQLSDVEWEVLTGVPRGTQPDAVPAAKQKPLGRLPALWAEHVQPFVVENWYMVAGIFMTIVGASLLAFYTWDRHWLIRYTLMPGMLALFTAGLARAGTWIAAKGAEFLGTAAMLRGAAIGLLPVNFMAVALLSSDDGVSQKVLAVSVMGLIYVVLAGWGLWRWCRAEHPALGIPMGGTLLMLNALVALGPMALTLHDGRVHHVVVGLGFYVGFALAAAAVIWFGMRCLDAAMLRERRVPWFFFVGLAATFVQVFLWVHGHGGWPQVHTYAALLVMAGGLALFYDLRSGFLSGEEKGEDDQLGGVTSLGFGLVLLGVMMSMADERSRVLALFLAGGVWVCQGVWRGRLAVAHFWIGLTFLALSVASVGLLEAFPKRWSPALGMGVALVCLLVAPVARSLRAEFGEALRGMHFAALVITVVVTLLTQWHLKTTPELTALWLVAIAGMFGLGARREQSVRWVHVAMVVLATAVPYMGFVDMRAHDWRGNTVIFGLAALSILWIGMSSLPGRFPTAARGRSTVLWFYGLLAVVAMVIRIYWEGARPAGISGFAKLMDLGGPCLMAGALMGASYFSRSLVAGGMAAVILVILFPELKATFEEVLPANLWGSGIGSSSTALGLALLAFWLRGARFLRELAPGDRFLDRYDFPLRRFDHTLATWPVIASVVFLTAKIIVRNILLYLGELGGGGVLGLLFGLALVVCAAVCVLLAVYSRKTWARSRVLLHLGMAVSVVGCFAVFARMAPAADWSWPAFASLAAMLGLHLLGRFGLRRLPWAQETLVRPTSDALSVWSAVAGVVAINLMAGGVAVSPMWALVVFVSGFFVWQELERRWLVHGVLMFLLVWCAVLSGSSDGIETTLWLMLALLALGTGLEFARGAGKFFWPLMRIQIWLATALVFCLAVLILAVGEFRWSWLLCVSLGLAARAHRSTPISVLAMATGYFWLAWKFELGILTDSSLGALGLIMALSVPLGRLLLERRPLLLRGLYPLRPFWITDLRVILWSAAGCAIASSLSYELSSATFSFAGRLHTATVPPQLPIFAALALVVIAWFRKSPVWGGIAVVASVQVNAHCVHDRLGEWLAAQGIGAWLVIATGLSLSALMISVLRELWQGVVLRRFLNQAGAVLGGLILMALAGDFFLSGALHGASWTALLASAAMASVAARGLRRAAREIEPSLEPFYQTALAMMICFAGFAIPALRSQQLVLVGSLLPAVYFWWRAERSVRPDNRYRPAALTLALIPVGLWLLRDVTGRLLFLGEPLADQWYHVGAPVVLLAGVSMRRLDSPIGVPVMMVASFFCVTAVPGWSPFGQATTAAWVAVGLGHLWIAVSHYRSFPLRGFFDSAGAMKFLVAMVHLAIAVAFGVDGLGANGALMLLGGSSVVLHIAFLRNSYWLHVLGVVEILVALYLEANSDGLFSREAVVWLLLGIWLVNLFFYDRVIHRVAPGGRNFFPMGFAALVFAEVLLTHGADSVIGLAGFACAGLLAAATRVSPAAQKGAVLLLAVPVWLTSFGVRNATDGSFALPVLLAVGGALAIAAWARSFQRGDVAAGEIAGSRLVHRLLAELRLSGVRLCALVNYVALVIAAAVQFELAVQGVAFSGNELLALLAVYAGSAVSWGRHGHFLPRLVAMLIVQLCVYLMFQAVRTQLLLTTQIWQAAYDIWATILASFVLVGCREMGSMSGRQSRASLTISLCAMPVVGLGTVWANGLGTDVALLVIGVQSMIFAYLGRGQRESPFNVVAIFGFVAFVMMVFWSKFDFRVLHAYVVPAGVGVLGLVQLFHRVIPAGTRNAVRLFTLLSMIGSTGYSALLDDRYPVVFRVTMLVLCLACMGLGSLLQVRLYLYLGFAGLLVDLGSITHKVLGSMPRGARMTAIGSLVLVGGIALLAAAIYYKTHRGAMDAVIRRWRGRLAAWE